MFRQRLLATLILVPLVLLGIFYGNPFFLGAMLSVLCIIMGWEWLSLIPMKRWFGKLIYLALLLGCIVLSFYWLNAWIMTSLFFWLLILLAVLTFPSSQRVWGNRIVVGFSGLLLLPLCVSITAALYQRPQGQFLIVYLLCLIWATDIGAYLVGKQWGRHKLIPAVSPGKTWEGAAGGLCLTLCISLIGFLYFKPTHWELWFWVAMVTSLMAMLGDLSISMLKRRCQLKDTGALIPGHGGALDRLDSLIAAFPLFYWLSLCF